VNMLTNLQVSKKAINGLFEYLSFFLTAQELCSLEVIGVNKVLYPQKTRKMGIKIVMFTEMPALGH